MKRLAFELILVVILAIVSCKYYNFRQDKNTEIRSVYQMLNESEEERERQRGVIQFQGYIILELSNEMEQILIELERYKKYFKV
jgi:hypothetical protein